ncbi:MAG: hypothetical protein AAF376_20005 [Pseudomonadota bacterium]
MMSNTDALTIYQDLLDKLSDAFISGEEDQFLPHIIYPHSITTETGVIHVPNRTSARMHFHKMSEALRAQGITHYVRSAKTAAFDGPDVILGTHTTRLLRNAIEAVPPFQNEMRLERENGVWGVRNSRHMAPYLSWPELLPALPNPPSSKGSPDV